MIVVLDEVRCRSVVLVLAGGAVVAVVAGAPEPTEPESPGVGRGAGLKRM
jgi:hypothetical protein